MNGRTARQCRDHWKNYLAPTVQSSPWTDKDIEQLIHYHKKYGPKWEKISKFFPGRTGSMIKNKYVSLIRKSDRIPYEQPPDSPQNIEIPILEPGND